MIDADMYLHKTNSWLEINDIYNEKNIDIIHKETIKLIQSNKKNNEKQKQNMEIINKFQTYDSKPVWITKTHKPNPQMRRNTEWNDKLSS